MSIESVQVKNGSGRLSAVRCAAERSEIALVLEETLRNRTHAAGVLGISRRTLLNKIKQYGLTRRVCSELVLQLPRFVPVMQVPS